MSLKSQCHRLDVSKVAPQSCLVQDSTLPTVSATNDKFTNNK